MLRVGFVFKRRVLKLKANARLASCLAGGLRVKNETAGGVCDNVLS